MSSAAPTPPRAPALRVDAVTKRFGATLALDDVSFALERGKIHALLGGNGSGKSTLIKILAGVYTADRGTISVGSASWAAASMTPSASLAAGLRFVHQQSSTFGGLTVAENIHLGRGFETSRFGRIRWRAVRRRTQELLDRFEIKARPGQDVGELSRATQAMIAIARALQDQEDASSGVLVLDEPTSSLPATEVDILFEALKRYAAGGRTIMFVTHRLDEVLEIADTAVILRDGRLVGQVERETTNAAEIVELMVGSALAHPTRDVRELDGGDIALSCDGLSGGSLRSVSLSLRRGEILGIAGLLGSGRSTLLRMLFGLLVPRDGRVVLGGREVSFGSPREAMAAGIAYVPEDRLREAAFLELSVSDNLSITTLGDYWTRGSLHHRRQHVDSNRLISDFRVKAASTSAGFGTLSGGNQQKAILARWLRRNPSVLLLDEPSQGVDVGARAELYTLIREATQRGTSVIVVSSEFEEFEHLCDRVLVFDRGVVTREIGREAIHADQLERIVQGAQAA